MSRNKPEAIIKLLDEVNAVIIGLQPSEYEVLSDQFAIPHPNRYWNPRYKARVWDGNVRFLSKNGKVSIHLLSEVVPILYDLGYKVTFIDKRDNISIKVPIIDKDYLIDYGIELGNHQVKAINVLTQNNGGMIRGGTGAGKTICCWVLHDLYYTHCKFETLIVVPTKDLVYQTLDEFKKFSSDVGMWSDGKQDTEHPVVVSTWQTLMNQPAFVGQYKVIIMDECHGGKEFTSQTNKILNDYGKNCYIKIGMTGTFPKDPCDMRSLTAAMGEILYEIPAKDLMNKGWLATMNLTMLCLNEDFRKEHEEYNNKLDSSEKKISYTEFKKTLFPEYTHETSFLVKNQARNEVIAAFVESKVNLSGNGVVLVNSVSHGKVLEKLIPNSKFIYGEDKTKVRKEAFKLFSTENAVIMITTYKLAAVGLNIKRIFNIFMVDAGKSFIRVIQTIGRGMRKDHDKSHVNVFDIYGNINHTARHATQRVSYYAEEGHKINEKLKVNYR